MVLSKRERVIAAVLAGAVAILVGDRFLLTPYMAAMARVKGSTAESQAKLLKDERLLSNRKRVNDAWRRELASGLKTDPTEAENQALHALQNAAGAARVDLQSFKPDRPARQGDFQPVRIQASGSANSPAMAEMLWRLENSGLPLRVNDVRLTARREGTDELGFQMSVTTIAYAPLPKTNKPAAAPEVTR